MRKNDPRKSINKTEVEVRCMFQDVGLGSTFRSKPFPVV